MKRNRLILLVFLLNIQENFSTRRQVNLSLVTMNIGKEQQRRSKPITGENMNKPKKKRMSNHGHQIRGEYPPGNIYTNLLSSIDSIRNGFQNLSNPSGRRRQRQKTELHKKLDRIHAMVEHLVDKKVYDSYGRPINKMKRYVNHENEKGYDKNKMYGNRLGSEDPVVAKIDKILDLINKKKIQYVDIK